MIADAFEWLVTFSSPYHLAWFTLSMALLLFALVVRRWRDAPHLWILLGHALVAIEAIIVIAADEGGQVFSVHCIWFNALMAFIHWRLLRWSRARTDRNDNDP